VKICRWALGLAIFIALLAPESSTNAQPARAPANTPAPTEGKVEESTFREPRGERRWLTLSYNPFTLQASRYGANAELLLKSHHVAELTLYWANTLTNEDSFSNRFRGIGGELGYRYYTGHDGPRGIYVGPSLLLGGFDAVPANGATTKFENYGVAIDVGYQALVGDRWVVGLGGGVQYNRPNKTFSQQELPASVYANPGVRPRLLLALGVAF